MTIEYSQSLLKNVSSYNQDVNEAARTVNEYTEMCKRGEISKEEFAELILDIQRKINIQADMAELVNMERLNVAINGLVAIARTV